MFLILIVFVAVFVGCDVGASLCVADVLHLMSVFFDADLADIPQGAHYSRHDGGGNRFVAGLRTSRNISIHVMEILGLIEVRYFIPQRALLYARG